MNLAAPPCQMALDVFAQWDEQFTERRKARQKEIAACILANPTELALVIASAMYEQPMKFGPALQALRDGDPFAFAALATGAVYSTALERA